MTSRSKTLKYYSSSGIIGTSKLVFSGFSSVLWCCSARWDITVGGVLNRELNDLRKIVWEKLKFLLKEFQFMKSLKICRRMADIVCHVPSNFQWIYTVCLLLHQWRHRSVTIATTALLNLWLNPWQNVVPLSSLCHHCDVIVGVMVTSEPFGCSILCGV